MQQIIDICNKLVSIKRRADDKDSLFSCQGQALDGYSELAEYRALIQELERALTTEDKEWTQC